MGIQLHHKSGDFHSLPLMSLLQHCWGQSQQQAALLLLGDAYRLSRKVRDLERVLKLHLCMALCP